MARTLTSSPHIAFVGNNWIGCSKVIHGNVGLSYVRSKCTQRKLEKCNFMIQVRRQTHTAHARTLRQSAMCLLFERLDDKIDQSAANVARFFFSNERKE